MTKQEGIHWESALARIIIESHLLPEETPYWAVVKLAKEILEYQDSQGVVIKVDRKLPETPRGDSYDDYCNGYIQAQEDMLEAGYVATESLIEEAQDVAVSM